MADYGEEWLVKTDQVRVRVNTIMPNKSHAWHYHTAVTDNIFCLEEGLVVEMRKPDETVRLAPGQRQEIPPRRVHHVVNTTAKPLRYLLIQATGLYDFIEVK